MSDEPKEGQTGEAEGNGDGPADEGKPRWQSKTYWFLVAPLIAAGITILTAPELEAWLTMQVGESWTGIALAVAGVVAAILREVTSEPIAGSMAVKK